MSVPRYWREIPQRYSLQASQCGVCEGVHYPPRRICPACRRASIDNMDAIHLAGKGRILFHTRVHKAAPGHGLHVPYTIAMIETEEGPRLVGQLVDDEGVTIHDGMHVEAAFRRIGSDGDAGVIHYGVKWRPVAQATVDGMLEEE